MCRILVSKVRGGHLVRLQIPAGKDTKPARRIAKAITAELSKGGVK
jgi:hypothetical protein